MWESVVAESSLHSSKQWRTCRSICDSGAESMRATRAHPHSTQSHSWHSHHSKEGIAGVEQKKLIRDRIYFYLSLYIFTAHQLHRRMNFAARMLRRVSSVRMWREKVMRIKLQILLHLWHVSQSPMDVRCDETKLSLSSDEKAKRWILRT